MTETTLNRCDRCGNQYEDIEIFDGVRLCPECLNYADDIDEPSGLTDLDDLPMYGEGYREEMLEEVAEIKAELDSL